MSERLWHMWLRTLKIAYGKYRFAGACGLDESHIHVNMRLHRSRGKFKKWYCTTLERYLPFPVVPVVGDNAAGAVGVGIVKNQGQAMAVTSVHQVSILRVTEGFKRQFANPPVHSFCQCIALITLAFECQLFWVRRLCYSGLPKYCLNSRSRTIDDW